MVDGMARRLAPRWPCGALLMAVLASPAAAGGMRCPDSATFAPTPAAGHVDLDGRPLPLLSASVWVSRFGDELSEDVPEASPQQRKQGFSAVYHLPINPDVVVFRCHYGRRDLLSLSLNVPKTAKVCWVRDIKDRAAPLGRRTEAGCDVALPP